MENKKDKGKKLSKRIVPAALSFAQLSILWLMIIFVLSIFEIIYNGIVHQFPNSMAGVLGWSFLNDLVFWCKGLIYFFLVYIVFHLISAKFARISYCVFIVFMAVVQLSLTSYFTTALVPLGADLYGYSMADIKQTVGAAGGVNFLQIIGFILLIGGTITALWALPNRIRVSGYIVVALPVVSFLLLVTDAQAMVHTGSFKSDYANNLVINKSDHFWAESYKHFFPGKEELDIYADSYISDYDNSPTNKISSFKYIDPAHYPFLHSDAAPDVLSPFIKGNATPPNIVIILVEGLGRAFTNEGAYLGNFTPFIDSLSGKSLYWKNFLSEGGRTFAVLPSVLGSLPFAKNGFLELGDNMPSHLSLLSLLKYNGYHTSFYYGGDAKFDNMATFLNKNSIDELNDEKSFPAGYVRLPAPNGFSWGYNDKELFRHYMVTRDEKATAPQLSVVLTVSTHSPFAINEEDKYLARFEERLTQLGFNDARKNECRNYKLQYASILYLDDALRGFFNAYSKRSDYNNTIFLITGDHRMPEIPMSDKIDRYHVPLIVYSPMLKRTAQMSSVSTHFDISPSLLAYLQHNYKIKGPSLVSWMGQGLDTNRNFENIHNYPLLQTKTDMIDFIMGEYHLNGDNLFKLNAELGEDPIQDEAKAGQLKNAFDQFKKRNAQIITGNWIVPDSIHQHYSPVKH
ncbi:MAG TPA: sulfatase-like hydrolase/transferase [Mucilaginibacter sp.]|jgi:phosphoglycerol transferase MdoB-like AlkP superfamily enzyme|nr:sulfatase-like hydrolase/transferase [Mucilaginibacter sp.]